MFMAGDDFPAPNEGFVLTRARCSALLTAGTDVARSSATSAALQPSDVTLDELRIELTYPQDAAAERFFREQDKAHQ
jgi:hypothetical protein